MNYWDSFREIQRLMESLRPAQEEIRRLQQVYEQLRAPQLLQDQVRALRRTEDLLRDAVAPKMRAQDLLAEFAKAQAVLIPPPAVLATAALLQAAIRPIPDLGSLGMEIQGMAALLRRLNVSIAEAPFLAELDLSDREGVEEPEPSNEVITQRAESRLVEIASRETVQTLREVEFAPIVLLDRALRHPEMMREMDARDFEGFIASLVQELGFEDVVLTPSSRDKGRDVLATKRIHGVSIFFAFECKRYAVDRPVGPDIARALFGAIMHPETRATKGVLVTTSRFTPSAWRFILTEPSLDGKDFDGIIGWLREYAGKKKAT